MSGASRVRGAFAQARAEGRAAFIAYVLAGHRTPEESLAVAGAALDGGADLLEIGVPFSDPVADGPTIAEAGRAAVRNGAGLETAREIVRRLRTSGRRQPLLLMTYRNPLGVGSDEVLTALATDGADGLIVPDLPAGEEPAFERAAARAGLALTFLVAPNTSPGRVEEVIQSSTGFVYVVPRYGVTGAGDHLAEGAAALVGRIRKAVHGRTPVAAGFGIARPAHVTDLRDAADGVVVGSLLVSTVAQAADGTAPDRVGELVAAMMAATARSMA